MPSPPVDVVYTWVDDAWPGYVDLLRQYASTRHDVNPNRTRDNLQVLKYSLRSLEAFAPWARTVYLVTCRPQIPDWLDRSAVRVVHHDEFMPANHLPTFNSFAIVANLHRLPDLSPRFVYVEDDRVFGRRVDPIDFFDDRDCVRVYEALRRTRAGDRPDAPDVSPWNLALAYSNGLLDARFGRQRRGQVKFAPLAVDRDRWLEMIEFWPDAFARTSASRFRAARNVAPEHLYPHFLLESGRGVRVPWTTIMRQAMYHPLNNVTLLQRAGFARLRWLAPKFACLNDNFDQRPNASAVGVVRRALERWFPVPSRFEVR
jgi:Stealth protein CR2, conserved region 2/Stealth protein CR3, conserved region 3/Stealth protein CR4, conserved region 4